MRLIPLKQYMNHNNRTPHRKQQSPDGGGCTDAPVETLEPSPIPPPTTPASRVPTKKKLFFAARKRKPSNKVNPQESASSQLMAYILAEKEAEKTNQKSEMHPDDAFLIGITPSLKSLDRILLVAAKRMIFNIVQEYEFQQLCVNSERPYMYSSALLDQRSSTSTLCTYKKMDHGQTGFSIFQTVLQLQLTTQLSLQKNKIDLHLWIFLKGFFLKIHIIPFITRNTYHFLFSFLFTSTSNLWNLNHLKIKGHLSKPIRLTSKNCRTVFQK